MNRATIKKLYRDAIVQVFGCGDKDLDAQLIKATKKDIHLSNQAPGQWSPNSALEIYCENGIPNASDIVDWAYMGFPSGGVTYNSDKWDTVDGVVNLMLEALGKYERYYHEPYNAAVVTVWKEQLYSRQF